MKEAIVIGITGYICGLLILKVGIARAVLLYMMARLILFLGEVGIGWIKEKGNKK